MIQARHPAREGLDKGRSMTAGRMRAWTWILLAGSLMAGACSSASSDSESAGGGFPSGGGRGDAGISLGGNRSGSGGHSSGAASSGMAGGAIYISVSGSESSDSSGGGSKGGASSYSRASAAGGAASQGGASSSMGSANGGIGPGSSMGGGGGASLSGSASKSGASGSYPTGGMTGAGGATKGTTGTGGGTALGGRTAAGGGTGTAPGGSTWVPSADAGASSDARGGGDCYFAGGAVTATVYPSGLTLRKACGPYFVSSISVYDDGVLTIEPGVTVRFSSGGALLVGTQSSGRLVASASASDPILFTSQETQPTPGFWRGLVFGGGTTSSRLAYAQVSAAGQNRDGAILGLAELPAHMLTVDHVTIDKVGDGASGIMAQGEKSSIAITNSAFVDVPADRYPLSVYAASFSSIGTGNTYPSGSAIEVMGGTIDTSVAWTNPGLPVAITADVSIEGTGSPVLSMGSGLNLKFGSNVAIQVGRSAPGKLAISGTSLARVTLTSLADTPASGSWAGVQIWDSGKASLSYTDVRYGGTNNGDSRGNVTLESSAASVQLTIDHSSFSDSLGWGIYVPCAGSSQNAAIITVDTNTTYASNALGSKGPGLTCGN